MEQNKFALVDNTTYYGKDAEGFYSKALLTGSTKSMIKLMPGVKSKEKIARLDLSNILQAADCTFTDGGTTTLSQKTIEVCDFKINLEFCIKDFENNYLSEQMRAGSNNGELPASFQSYVLDQIAAPVSTDLERLLWQGDTAASPADLCDGLLKQFLADAAVIDVTGTTLSASNIIAELAKVYAAIPNTIANKGKVVIFVSVAASKFYKQALAALNNALIGSYNNGDFQLSYIDIPVVVAEGLPTNIMVAAEPMNLIYATDLISDENQIKVLPMIDRLGTPTVRILTHFKFGNNYQIGEEVVYYH